MRIPLFLSDHHVPFQTLWHPPAFTAQRMAKWLRLPGRQVTKSVLLAVPSGFIVAVLPATHRVNLEAAGGVLSHPVRLAERSEIAQFFRDCQWGNVVPFGTLYGLSTIVDASVDPTAPVVFQAQRHFLAIRMRYPDYERLEQPRRCRFAEPVHPEAVPAPPQNDR